MSVVTKRDSGLRTGSVPGAWEGFWEWLARPLHYTAVRRFRMAAQEGDGPKVASLLHTDVAVVVASTTDATPEVLVVRGARDATAVLMHGLAPQPELSVMERSVNGQAGLVVSLRGRATAMLTVDFTGRFISMVWVALRPEMLRNWNAV